VPRQLRLLLPLLLLLALPLRAQESQLSREAVDRIERLIRDEMAAQKIPGLSVSVATSDELRWSQGFGVADLENQVPVRKATIFRLASISKPITATAVMQLTEEGKLALDLPIQQYVASFPQKQWPVTTRQLLGHLGGIRHYQGNEIASTRRYESVTEALSIFKDDPLLHEPGTKYSYTTYGYNVLGAAVERASGKRFEEYLQERIFKPAGMDRIRVDDSLAIIPNRAQGYRRLPDGALRNSILADVTNKVPGGGLCGTSEDLVKFAIATNRNQLVKAATRDAMWTRQKLRDGTETEYGFGWNLATYEGRREVRHGGGQPRVATLLYLLPDQRCSVALMTNLEGAKLLDLARRISEAAR
jgi:serine beta-lactamase-like protein LACTB